MKRRLFTFALAALTIGLLGSCSKINERIDGLDKRVYDLENNKIASVEQQIATINQSIADLSTIRTNIQTLMDAKTAMGEDITKLKAADQTLEGKINDLKTYVDTELAKYATKDWANATFATLAKQAEIITDVEKLKTGLAGLDTKLDQAIANLDSSLKGWVNEQLSGYYTIAQVDAKVDGIQSDIDALKTDNETNKTKIEELETSLTQLTQDLENAKTTIKAEYEKAIKDAIEGNDGYITETIKTAIATANGKIDDLTERVGTLETTVAALSGDVDALKAMIQTVSIIPAYNDGSLKAEDGILTINCVITPKEAVDSLKKENFTILTSESEVLTKSALYGTLTIAKDEDLVLDKTNGTATIKVDVSSVLPAEEDKALTVAVNIKNSISDFTTEFVPVYVYVAPEPVAPEGFVYLGVKDANGKPLFWAECNLGASNPEDCGYYYFWAGTTGYTHDGSKWVIAGTTTELSDGFCKSNAPYYENSAYTKYTGSDSRPVLDSADDAATVTNPNWRTPTKYEFVALAAGCVWWWTDNYNSTGKAGYIVYKDKTKNGADKGKANMNGTWKRWNGSSYINDSSTTESYSISDTHIFFPAAGYGSSGFLFNAGAYGRYWSSSLVTDNASAFCLDFTSSLVLPQSTSSRYVGRSVRPVTIESSDPKPVVPVTGVTLDKTELSLKVGNSETLKATVQPADATNQNVIWSSDNTGVATVGSTDGKVTAVAEGTATITAIVDGLYTATCTVTVKASSEPEYVVMKMGSDQSKELKWATMNLGAEKVTDCGDYFAWGEKAPYYEGTGGWPKTPKWKSGKESGYSWQSYCGSSSFSEWNTPPYDDTKILKPECDAAAQIIGDGWRMPTSAEFKALYDACLNGSYDTSTNPSGASASVGKGVYWCTNYDGVAGCLFCDGNNKLFFPATGIGNDIYRYSTSTCFYWSSSLNTAKTNYADNLNFSKSDVKPQANSVRYSGMSVRPVKEVK